MTRYLEPIDYDETEFVYGARRLRESTRRLGFNPPTEVGWAREEMDVDGSDYIEDEYSDGASDLECIESFFSLCSFSSLLLCHALYIADSDENAPPKRKKTKTAKANAIPQSRKKVTFFAIPLNVMYEVSDFTWLYGSPHPSFLIGFRIPSPVRPSISRSDQ